MLPFSIYSRVCVCALNQVVKGFSITFGSPSLLQTGSTRSQRLLIFIPTPCDWRKHLIKSYVHRRAVARLAGGTSEKVSWTLTKLPGHCSRPAGKLIWGLPAALRRSHTCSRNNRSNTNNSFYDLLVRTNTTCIDLSLLSFFPPPFLLSCFPPATSVIPRWRVIPDLWP